MLDPFDKLSIINQAPIEAEWDYNKMDQFHILRLTLPYECAYRLDISHREDGKLCATTAAFDVDKELRQNHIGTRLIRAGVAIVKLYRITSLRSHVESPYALKIAQNIFGEQGLTLFHDGHDRNDPDRELPITIDQAIASLERAGEFEEFLDNREFGFDIQANITDLDTTGWELAVEVNVPRPQLG